MGYYKDLDVLDQEKIDRVVRWWRTYEGVIPDYLMVMIIEDSQFWEKASEAFEKHDIPPAPKPATDHIALQQDLRRPRNAKRSWDFTMSHSDGAQIMAWLTVSVLLNLGLTMWLAVSI